jgi:hypothetical protein
MGYYEKNKICMLKYGLGIGIGQNTRVPEKHGKYAA